MSILDLQTKTHEISNKHQLNSEEELAFCETLLRLQTEEERSLALDIDMWQIEFNKNVIIQRADNRLELSSETVQIASKLFSDFSVFFTNLTRKEGLLSKEMIFKLQKFAEDSTDFMKRVSEQQNTSVKENEKESLKVYAYHSQIQRSQELFERYSNVTNKEDKKDDKEYQEQVDTVVENLSKLRIQEQEPSVGLAQLKLENPKSLWIKKAHIKMLEKEICNLIKDTEIKVRNEVAQIVADIFSLEN